MARRSRNILKLNNAEAAHERQNRVERIHSNQMNLTLLFKSYDCSGEFVYPNGNRRQAKTAEMISFFILVNHDVSQI